jgi:peptidoglycan/LPS O-acetylase OafA/YrhL
MKDKSQRDAAIDILRFFAVFFITWSHFDLPLGKYGALATGGAFGDTLFFFISGYTL